MSRWGGAWSSLTRVTPTPAGPGRSAPCRMVTPSAGVRWAAKLRKISRYRTKNICSARPHPQPRHHLRVQARVCEGPRLPEWIHLPGTVQHSTIQYIFSLTPSSPRTSSVWSSQTPATPPPAVPGQSAPSPGKEKIFVTNTKNI